MAYHPTSNIYPGAIINYSEPIVRNVVCHQQSYNSFPYDGLLGNLGVLGGSLNQIGQQMASLPTNLSEQDVEKIARRVAELSKSKHAEVEPAPTITKPNERGAIEETFLAGWK